jgi:hypothetical protein
VKCVSLAWSSSARLSKSWQFLASPSFHLGTFVTCLPPFTASYTFSYPISLFCNRIRPQFGRYASRVDSSGSSTNGLLVAPPR